MAAPEISASITVNANANAVWQRVADLSAMGRRSPQCKKMIVLKRRGTGAASATPSPGTITLNVNNQGLLWWPTWAVVTEATPGKVFEFKIPLNGTRWRFELEESADGSQTTLTETRLVPGGRTSLLSRVLVASVLGGEEKFEAGLQKGIRQTIRALAMEAERS